MTRRLISTGSPFERMSGYSRAVVDGDFVFVAGTTGYDYATMIMPATVEEQTRNALATIGRVLAEAGFAPADVVRATYYLTDISDAQALLPIFGEFFRDIRPAATLVAVTALVRPEMKIEIEVTAKRRS
jgi:enamine deaminase RidA (YjgF/YER057c/UK114 family)